MPAPKDTEPGAAPTQPPSLPADNALWDEADMRLMHGPAASFADPPLNAPDGPVPTIGHIGRYALKHQLGEGGIGTVYAAHDPLLSRLIAVKTLHVEVEEHERESFNALFLNEARAAASLNHPNIVTVFDAGISDDRAYIAMELLKGRDLRQLRQDGWRATPAQAALIVRRVADALGYAHSKGVVHRDVKPANIFMIGRSQPKVLDFGIARIAHQHDAPHSRGGDIAAGSPYYMAPEQVRHEQVDRRADVFSLGVVLYELLTDLKPFRGNTLDEITVAVLKHDPPFAHLVDPAVPEALAQITARALSKNPEHRFRSARALSRELSHWLAENTVTSDGDVQVGSARRHRPLWLALVAFVTLALGTIAWTLLGAQRSVAPTPRQAAAASAPVEMPALAASTAPAVAPAVAASIAPNADTTPAPAATLPMAPPLVREAEETSKERRAREAREREARLAAAATPPRPVAAASTGLVRVAISPWGEVEVDGKTAGTSPPLTELSLSAGRHQIVVRNTDLPAYSGAVNVTADQPVSFKHKF